MINDAYYDVVSVISKEQIVAKTDNDRARRVDSFEPWSVEIKRRTCVEQLIPPPPLPLMRITYICTRFRNGMKNNEVRRVVRHTSPLHSLSAERTQLGAPIKPVYPRTHFRHFSAGLHTGVAAWRSKLEFETTEQTRWKVVGTSCVHSMNRSALSCPSLFFTREFGWARGDFLPYFTVHRVIDERWTRGFVGLPDTCFK
jgi:hypothetical protein